MFRTVPLSIIRSSFTVHSAMVYVIQVCRQLSSRSICFCSKAVYKPVWHIPLLSVQWINSWWWADELAKTCRVSWQNKFVKLAHLVGFITLLSVQWINSWLWADELSETCRVSWRNKFVKLVHLVFPQSHKCKTLFHCWHILLYIQQHTFYFIPTILIISLSTIFLYNFKQTSVSSHHELCITNPNTPCPFTEHEITRCNYHHIHLPMPSADELLESTTASTPVLAN